MAAREDPTFAAAIGAGVTDIAALQTRIYNFSKCM